MNCQRHQGTTPPLGFVFTLIEQRKKIAMLTNGTLRNAKISLNYVESQSIPGTYLLCVMALKNGNVHRCKLSFSKVAAIAAVMINGGNVLNYQVQDVALEVLKDWPQEFTPF
jgi:hypothetical protein